MTNDVFLGAFRGKLSDMSLFSQAFQNAVTENWMWNSMWKLKLGKNLMIFLQ